MTYTITPKELAQQARRLGEEFPDRKAFCAYTKFEDDKLVPNCIVGQAAFNLGISIEDLRLVNTCSIYPLAMDDCPVWLDTLNGDTDPYITWLANLQCAQDGGKTWGEALATADRRLVNSRFDI